MFLIRKIRSGPVEPEKNLLKHVVGVAAGAGHGVGQPVDCGAVLRHGFGGIGPVITSFCKEYPAEGGIAAKRKNITFVLAGMLRLVAAVSGGCGGLSRRRLV